MEMSTPVTGSKTERWEHDREMFRIMNQAQEQMRHLIFLNSRRVHRDFSSDLCFSKIYFRCCWFKSWVRWRATGAVWGTHPSEERCSWNNEHGCLWKGQDPPTSTEFLAQTLCEYKCNALKEKSTCFTASRIFLFVLHPPVVTGGIWECQALAHMAVVYDNSSAARWCHKSLYLKMGRSVMKATSLIL